MNNRDEDLEALRGGNSFGSFKLQKSAVSIA